MRHEDSESNVPRLQTGPFKMTTFSGYIELPIGIHVHELRLRNILHIHFESRKREKEKKTRPKFEVKPLLVSKSTMCKIKRHIGVQVGR